VTAWTLSDVSYAHPGATSPAISHVSARLEAGRLTALLGPNGAGKSTLLQLLLGTLRPSDGSVRFRDRDAAEWGRRAIAREIGVVPQGEIEPLFTVRDVVAMGRYPHLGLWQAERPEDMAAIDRAMARCDVVQFADRWLTTLSGGERQRARVARALAQEPSFLVLDEPTTFLDIRHEMATFALLRSLREQGTTVVIATHNVNLAARFADDLLLMRAGRLLAQGSPDAVLTVARIANAYEWPVHITRHTAGAPQLVPLDAAGR
jgi:ABC-type cobalamin/Fe3+-siderophores transport system ATPase subunit